MDNALRFRTAADGPPDTSAYPASDSIHVTAYNDYQRHLRDVMGLEEDNAARPSAITVGHP